MKRLSKDMLVICLVLVLLSAGLVAPELGLAQVIEETSTTAVAEQINSLVDSLEHKLYAMRRDPKWPSRYKLSSDLELTRIRPYSNISIVSAFDHTYGGGVQDTEEFLGVDGLGVYLRPNHFIELSDFYYSLLTYCESVKQIDPFASKQLADYYALLKLIQIDYRGVTNNPFEASDVVALDSIHCDFYQLIDLLAQE